MSNLSVIEGTSQVKGVTTRIVATPTDFHMAMAVRAAVFLAEEDSNITYFDEFYDNDWCATHILAFVDGDPAGVIRCRWFADFALIERVGIRKRYRSFRVLIALGRAALKLCAQKGYRTVAGRARLNTVDFWKRLGGRQSGAEIQLHRGRVIPIVHDLDPGEQPRVAPTMFGHPAFEDLITQPEGRWDFTAFRAALRSQSHATAAE